MEKELSEEQRQGAEMTREQEKELIVKNAFEFLKRQDLVLKGNNIILPLSEERKIKKDYTVNQLCYNGISINIFYIKNKTLYFLYEYTNKDLIELFNKKLNELQAKQQQTEQLHRETLEETRKWKEQQEQAKQPQDTTDYTIKYDQNKPKLSQFPREAMEAVAEVMEYGARKYGSGTWSRVEAQRYVDAAARHLYAMQDIDENGRECINLSKIDEESGLEHLYHLACNVVYAVAIYRRTKRNETR